MKFIHVKEDPVDTMYCICSSPYYGDTAFADYTLTSSDGEDFQVHRLILAKQSEFFSKLFTVDMKEKETKSVKFEDVNAATLEKVLKFIYTGEMNVPDYNMLKNLLYAAEKFGFNGLKKFCVDKMKSEVKKENVLDIFSSADMYNLKELEEECFEIIIE